ncbi:MAG: hypothetical protein AB4426_16700 [Xenococcaceae cyanobacterium]
MSPDIVYSDTVDNIIPPGVGDRGDTVDDPLVGGGNLGDTVGDPLLGGGDRGNTVGVGDLSDPLLGGGDRGNTVGVDDLSDPLALIFPPRCKTFGGNAQGGSGR